MFGGGRLAGSPGVGLAVAQHLSSFEARGAVLWPRPETMRFYQDKLALRELFTRVGVPTPSSWVVGSLNDLETLLSEPQAFEKGAERAEAWRAAGHGLPFGPALRRKDLLVGLSTGSEWLRQGVKAPLRGLQPRNEVREASIAQRCEVLRDHGRGAERRSAVAARVSSARHSDV